MPDGPADENRELLLDAMAQTASFADRAGANRDEELGLVQYAEEFRRRLDDLPPTTLQSMRDAIAPLLDPRIAAATEPPPEIATRRWSGLSEPMRESLALILEAHAANLELCAGSLRASAMLVRLVHDIDARLEAEGS